MVDKRLILAVAGSGKTYHLISQLNDTERFFLVTYTVTSANLLRKRIVKRFGFFPTNINVFTYFDFLYNFCVKPFVFYKYNLKGIYLEPTPDYTSFMKNDNLKKYLSSNGYLYHNRISKFLEYENLLDDVRNRLELFCDYFFYDEVQDLGGHDFSFILELTKANVNFTFVGDFYQHTYVTSYDGKVNSNLHLDYTKYKKRFSDFGIIIDTNTLNKSWRCSTTICNYIKQNLNIEIDSHRKDETEIIFVDDKHILAKLLNDNQVVKLLYNNSSKRNFRSKNWGDCKGEDDYITTCIILNKTTMKLYEKSQLNNLAPRTKNKLYVALSRTKGNCFLVPEDLI